jgi:predicted transcriptional regulator of viral defense system
VTRPSLNKRVADLLGKAGIVRTREFESLGVSRTQLRRLCEQGVIERVSRGLYSRPQAVFSEKHSLAEAARRVPAGVICLISALRFHGLTTQNPSEVWIAIAGKAWRPKAGSPRLQLVHYSGTSLGQGVERHDVGGVQVRVFGAAKTVADCFKFRSKVGIDVATEALRDYRRKHPKELRLLWRFAEIDRVTRIIRPYLEALG